MRVILILCLCILSAILRLSAQHVKISNESQECMDCHMTATPGIVHDWLESRHAKIIPSDALKKPELEQRISSKDIPALLQQVAVGCYECHMLNASSHRDNFEHNGFKINVIVTPNDCKTCHQTEVTEYAGSKKAHALDILRKNPIYSALQNTITGVRHVRGSVVNSHAASELTKGETCYACHGTSVEVKGLKTVSTSSGDVEVPNLINWPNQGVGRINPDGSMGACTACHPRHSFSIEIARKPYTCSQCHLEPDVPAWEVYRESKHGNIFQSREKDITWDSVPWNIGKDFRTPTCATCHNSLITTPENEVVVRRTHNFGDRLWIRIFGLIYSHPQPRDGKTYTIKNADGLPLPTTFTGTYARESLLSKEEQAARQTEMAKVCQSCHGTSWTNLHFTKFHSTVAEADSMVLAATQLLLEAWKSGFAEKTNPFDEALEQLWVKQWLFYANSTRYASAMSGPDYASFKNGWWEMMRNLEEMRSKIQNEKSIKKSGK